MNMFLAIAITFFNSSFVQAYPHRQVQVRNQGDHNCIPGQIMEDVTAINISDESRDQYSFDTVIHAGDNVFVCDEEEGYTGILLNNSENSQLNLNQLNSYFRGWVHSGVVKRL